MGQDSRSNLFSRLPLNAWRAAGGPSARRKAKEKVRTLIDGPNYILPAHVQRDVDAVYDEAVRAVGA